MIPIIIMAIENDDDREFMIRLYEQNKKLLYSTAKSIVHDNFIAEDMVQDALAKLIENIEKIEQIDCCVLPAYLVICIKRVCFDYIKHKKVEDKHVAQSMDDEQVNFEYEDEKSNVENSVLLMLDVEKLKGLVKQLPEKYKDVLNYKYLLELTDAEIAELIGIKKDSVRQYLSRARRAAYALYEEDGHE